MMAGELLSDLGPELLTSMACSEHGSRWADTGPPCLYPAPGDQVTTLVTTGS